MFHTGDSTRTDGDLVFLTDSAYFSLLDHSPKLAKSTKGRDEHDGLFLERLDSFIEAQFRDMDAFANREQRTLDEIRKLVAIPHAKFLFSKDPILPLSTEDETDPSIPSVRNTLAKLSSTLQILHSTAGLDSLLLVVSPSSSPSSVAVSTPGHDSSTLAEPTRKPPEASWIGGTDLGKEFWMGLKGGGVNGAKAFRTKCQMRHEAEILEQEIESSAPVTPIMLAQDGPASSREPAEARTSKIKSGDVKTELNAVMRHALRSASGNPSAEMRWTKPASLEELYNVRMVGWPTALEQRNPSNNSVKDNKILLDLIRGGRIRFVKRGSPEWDTASSIPRQELDASISHAMPSGNPPQRLRHLQPEEALRQRPISDLGSPGVVLGSSRNLDSTSQSVFSPIRAEHTASREVPTPVLRPPDDDSPRSGNNPPEREVLKRKIGEAEAEGRRQRAKIDAEDGGDEVERDGG